MSPGQAKEPLALIRDNRSGQWLFFHTAAEILTARTADEIRALLTRAESYSQSGKYAVVLLNYEAADAFDCSMAVHSTDGPRAYGLLLESPSVESRLPPAQAVHSKPLVPSISHTEYLESASRIREALAAGETYQVNYSFPCTGSYDGSPLELFCSLYSAQPVPYAAFVNLDQIAILSLSPELFFDRSSGTIRCKPMKGTSRRGETSSVDDRRSSELATSVKARAENLMIVDMTRNDLARIAEPGTVSTKSICAIERYRSVLQMVSTVEARTRASLVDTFGALFPCASITGAPKIRSMELIKTTERAPRGIYTGAIALLRPDSDIQCSVAIRTAIVDKRTGSLRYDVGSGVVWDSDSEEEWNECLLKGSIFDSLSGEWHLFETLRYTPENGFFLLHRHLERLIRSAVYYDVPIDRAALRAELDAYHNDEACVVRVQVDDLGRYTFATRALPGPSTPRLTTCPFAIRSDDPTLHHKTSNRTVYSKARECCPGYDDVVFWNERGEITETTIGNIAVELNGEWITPPLTSGVLPGTLREELLAAGDLREETVRVEQLADASRFARFNSIRGFELATFDRRSTAVSRW